MKPQNFDWLRYFMVERHSIYLNRLKGEPWPWTKDEILQTYKFTNVFRELDRTTVWMRKHFTIPNEHHGPALMIFNCCFFRVFGTIEFAEAAGFQTKWDPEGIITLAAERLDRKQRVFTGAYIITNQGLKLPKEQVVTNLFLTPLWEAKEHLADVAVLTKSLEATHKALSNFKGWGGGGFMAYEAVSDLRWTDVLLDVRDHGLWANAGPGAVRGLNRIYGRPLDKRIHEKQAVEEMRELLHYSKEAWPWNKEYPLEMREIEHCLCETDKYLRVRNGEGRPRSLYRPPQEGSEVAQAVKAISAYSKYWAGIYFNNTDKNWRVRLKGHPLYPALDHISIQRLVASEARDMALHSYEFVVFRDGNKVNFDPSNLEVKVKEGLR